MPYQNDMATLASIVGGGAAASQAGIQDDLENQKQMIANQVAQGTQAADIAKPYLNNLFTGQQIGAEQGVAAQQQAKGAQDQALLPGNIALGQAKNATDIDAQKIQRFQQVGQLAGQVAGLMDGVPGPARPAAMQQLADKLGIDPQTMGPLMSGDPDQLRQFSQKLIQSSSAYQMQMGEIGAKGGAQLANTELENQGKRDVATISAGGRLDVANVNAKAKTMMMKTDNIIAQLTAKQAQGALTPDEANTLNQARAAQQLAKTNPFINQMLQPDADASTNQMPVAQTGSVGATPPAGNALEAAMRRRGLLK
jgi:hypothetical protein